MNNSNILIYAIDNENDLGNTETSIEDNDDFDNVFDQYSDQNIIFFQIVVKCIKTTCYLRTVFETNN